MTFYVRYQLADYHGVRRVEAEDPEGAVASVRCWARKQTTLPMYSDSYRVLSSTEIAKALAREASA